MYPAATSSVPTIASGAPRLILRLSDDALDPTPVIATGAKKRRLSGSSKFSYEEVVIAPPQQPQLKLLRGRIEQLERDANDYDSKAHEMKEDIAKASVLFVQMLVDRSLASPPATQQTADFSQNAEESDVAEEEVSFVDLRDRINKVSVILKEMIRRFREMEGTIGLEDKKRTLLKASLEEEGSGSWSAGVKGSQEISEGRLEELLEVAETKRRLIQEKIGSLLSRISFWKIIQWEKQELNDDEVEIILSSSIKLVEAQQEKELAKVGLSNFSMPEVFMQCKRHLSMAAVSCESVKKENKPDNQDRFFLSNFTHFSCYGVCDGHGREGGDVAEKISRLLPTILEKMLSEEIVKSRTAVVNVIRKAFYEMDQLLVDFQTSGSTLTCVIRTPLGLFVAAIGDSRAVLDVNGKARQLSADQTAKDSYFNEIVKMRGAEIKRHPLDKINGSYRVYPGWCMVTKDMGNHSFQKQGLKIYSCLPEIIFIPNEDIVRRKSYAIIASDSFWEYVNSDQMVAAFRARLKVTDNLENIAKELVSACYHAGNKKFRDDTTIVIVRL